jgi:hypothetical protein
MLDKLVHFLEGEILAWPARRIQKPPRGYCPIYSVRDTPAPALFRR